MECVNDKKNSENRQKYLIFLCWFVYTIAQIARYSYSSNVTLIMEKYGVSHAAAGLPATFYFFAYGAGQIVTGLFCKKYNKRLVVTGALTVSALCNLALFLGVDFTYVKYIWLVNGFAQANLWPLLLLHLGENVSDKYKRAASITMSSATHVGTLLAYALGVIFADNVNVFHYTFFVGAMVAVLAAALWFFTNGKKSTQPIMPESEAFVENKTAPKKGMSVSTILLLGLFAEFAMMSLAISGGLRQWVPSIMKESYGLSDRLSIFLTLLLPLVSIVCCFIAAWLYARIKNFVVIIGGMFLLSVVLFGALFAVLNVSWILLMIVFILLTMTMSIIQNQLTTQAPLYMQDQVNTGFMAGMMNGCSYIGNAMSTYGLGWIADRSGWNAVFVILTVIAIFSTALAMIYGFVRKRKTKNVKSISE